MKRKNNRIYKGTCFLTAAALLCGCAGAPSHVAEGTRAASPTMEAATTAAAAAGAAADEAWPMEGASETWEADPEGTGRRGNPSLSMKYQEAYKNEDFNTEEYSYISENGYKNVMEEPLSTFSIDVDTAAYSLSLIHI